jgi:hypothetical protein
MDILTSKKLFYPACPNKECKFQVLDQIDNTNYNCKKCHQQCSIPLFRYNFIVKFGDIIESVSANVFGNEMIGKLFTQLEMNKILQISAHSDFILSFGYFK